MTNINVNYWRYMEEKRHNLQTEANTRKQIAMQEKTARIAASATKYAANMSYKASVASASIAASANRYASDNALKANAVTAVTNRANALTKSRTDIKMNRNTVRKDYIIGGANAFVNYLGVMTKLVTK